jgi:hypothetical protein
VRASVWPSQAHVYRANNRSCGAPPIMMILTSS